MTRRNIQTKCIAGVDEAGRGPLAGPVVVSAVVLDSEHPIRGLKDSKLLSAKRRLILADRIRERAAAWSVIYVHAPVIDDINILNATLLGMSRSVEQLGTVPDIVLVDGNRIPDIQGKAEAIVGGDRKVRAISAASILAKTARDAYMENLESQFPDYGFARHKGYPTKQHLEALRRMGPMFEHRRSFAPVRDLLQGELFGPAERRVSA